MHSSRMRTGRSLTVCWSLLPGGGSGPGGCLLPGGSGPVPGVCSGGVWSRGVSASGGVCSGGQSGPRGVGGSGPVPGGLLLGGSAPRGVSQHALRQNTPPLWTESQTPVKTLPWPNYVAAGKYTIYTVPN